MRHYVVIILMACLLPLTAMSTPQEDVAQLFHNRGKQQGKKRSSTANQLMQSLLAEGFGDDITFDDSTPPDTLVMTASYYAEEYFVNTGLYDLAVEAGLQTLPLTEHHGDYTWRSETLSLLTLAYLYKANYIEALRYGEMGYDHDSRHKDYDRLSSTLNTIAGIYLAAKQPAQAREYIERAIEADQKTAGHEHAAAIHGIACEIYQELGDYKTALSHGSQAFELEQQRGNGAKAAIRLSQMAAALAALGDTAQAHQLLRQSIPVLQQQAVMPSLGISLNTLGEVMRLEGRIDDAARYFDMANQLFTQTGDLYNQARSVHGLFAALYDTDPKAAMLHLDHYNKLKDTIYQNDMRQLLSNYSAKFRNDELAEQNAAAKRQNRTIIIGGTVIGVLMLLALALLVYAIRLKNKSNHQLLELQRTRENFFTNITHEFRTPLTVILGMSQQLIDFTPPEDTPELVHTSGNLIRRQGSQLLLLINQLLDLSKVQARVEAPNWRRDNIVGYINMIMETFYSYAQSQKISLVYAPQENTVVMDFVPDYVQKITNNLVHNAIKFTPSGGHINIITRCDGDQFVFQIADDGIGISREHLQHIFEPFYQADNEKATIGTGVGLALTRQLINAVDGTIKVVSSKERGTVFTVTMPLSHGGDADLQPLTAAERSGINPIVTQADGDGLDMPEGVDDQAEPIHVLVVEDSRDVAYFIGNQLAERYAISYAYDGQDGLDKAQQLVPDLIITDLMMPKMDGLEFCRNIRSNDVTSHIPIIVITARSANEDLVKGINAGADAYLYKPFNADELQAWITKLLDQRRLLREKFSRIVVDSNGSIPDAADNGSAATTTSAMDDADVRFLGRLTDLVYSYMGRSQVDVESLATALCMSSNQLRRKVMALTGKTPANYFMQIRLSNAKAMLDKNPEMPISDVAYRCGFSTPGHFSSAFKAAYGYTPTQWIHRAR